MTTFMQSTKALMKLIKFYLPEEHKNLVELEVDGRISFKQGTSEMKIYGDETNLAAHVSLFRSFPGSDTFFGTSLTEPIMNLSVTETSLSNKKYIYKQYLFKCLQERIYDCNESLHFAIMPIVFYYLRVKEKQLKGLCEFTLCQEEKLDEFKKSLKAELSTFSNTEKQFELTDLSPSTIFEKFKAVIPKTDYDPEYDVLFNFVKDFIRRKPMNPDRTKRVKNKDFYEKWLNITAINIRIVDKFIDKHPEMFLPTIKGPATIRMFFDMGRCVVMVHELQAEMRRANLHIDKVVDEEISMMPMLSTWNAGDALQKIGSEHFNKIEVVMLPVYRTKHRAVYIPTFDGKYCITAADVIKEILHDMITVRALFQSLDSPDLNILISHIVCAILTVSKNGTHFVTLDCVNMLRSCMLQVQKREIPHILPRTKRRVKEVNSRGFTAEELNIELFVLGLRQTFMEEIIEYSESVVDTIKNAKQTGELDTSDMYEALEKCQIICLMNRSQEIRDYLHASNFCTTSPISCGVCRKEALETKVEEARQSTDTSISELAEEIASTSVRNP